MHGCGQMALGFARPSLLAPASWHQQMEPWVAAAVTRELAAAIAGVANATEIARENANAHGHKSVVWAIDANLAVQEPSSVAAAKRAFAGRAGSALLQATKRAKTAPVPALGGVFIDGKTIDTTYPKAVIAYWHLLRPAWGCVDRLEGATPFEAVEHAASPAWIKNRAKALSRFARGLQTVGVEKGR